MSHTYTRTVYQVVFATKHRKPCLLGREEREKLFRYMGGIIKQQRCIMYQAGGIEDHLHLVFSLHPAVALSRLVKDIKLASSRFIKAEGLFPYFDYWQVGFAAFSYTPSAIPNLVRYAQNQIQHHRGEASLDELRRLLYAHGIDFDERYFE